MTFRLKKTRSQNTMTWPEKVGNRISEDLNFRGCPRTPLQGTAFEGPTIEPPSVKSWIRPRYPYCNLTTFPMYFNSSVYHSIYMYRERKTVKIKLASPFQKSPVTAYRQGHGGTLLNSTAYHSNSNPNK